MPESINVQYGSVKWQLEALVGRTGWFSPNIAGTKEVTLVRVPGENSIERTEPIVHRKCGDDSLRYDIVISGKCFALGSQIPIAFTFTPLATVRCLRVEMALTEEVERYATDSNSLPSRYRRSIRWLERDEDGTISTAFLGSSVKPFFAKKPDDNEHEKVAPRVTIAQQNNTINSPEAQTEIVTSTWDFLIQLPKCDTIKEHERIHVDTISKHIQVRHWIKVTMIMNLPDSNSIPEGRNKKITVNFPIRILSCHATPANIDLPAYSEPDSPNTINNECALPMQPLRLHSDCDSAVQFADGKDVLFRAHQPPSPPAYDSLVPSDASTRCL